VTTKRLPKNDSLRIKFRVRQVGGAYLSLTGFSITITIDDLAGISVYSGAGSVLSPDTTAMAFVPASTMATPGVFNVAVRAQNASTNEGYTATMKLIVEDHA
jgi:hypothetical protein